MFSLNTYVMRLVGLVCVFVCVNLIFFKGNISLIFGD